MNNQRNCGGREQSWWQLRCGLWTGFDLHSWHVCFARITFGPDGLLYAANRSRIQRVDRDGTVSTITTVPDVFQDTLTGLAFDVSGSLMFSEIFPRVFRLAPGAAMPTVAYTLNTLVPPPGTLRDFFSEALVLGPDRLMYGSSFPDNPANGLIYQVDVNQRQHSRAFRSTPCAARHDQPNRTAQLWF